MDGDILYEYTNIDIVNDLLSDPQFAIQESTYEVFDYIKEAANGVTKKNIFQRLKDLILRCFNFIISKCKQIKSFWCNLFSKKEVSDKTLDEIAKLCFGETKELPSKHLNFEYANGNAIKFNYVANAVKRHIKPTKVPGHDFNDRKIQEGVILIFKIIKDPKIIDSLISSLEEMQQNNSTYSYSVNKLKKVCKLFWIKTIAGSLSCTVTLEQFTELTAKVSRLHTALKMLDDHTMGSTTIHTENNDEKSNKELLDVMNNISDIAIILQLGLNYIGDGMREIYVLDEKYHNNINSKNFKTKLPLFVKTCIESNIPTKYINQAIFDICDVSINSYPNDPTKKKDSSPLKGNGRFVLFPGDKTLRDKVIKVAYNNLGMRGNRNEFSIWEKVKGIQEIASNLYHVYDIGDKSNLCILCDRVSPIDKYSETDEWNKKMKDQCIKHKIGFIIRCNSGGFGKNDNNKIICADYGNVKRI